MSQFTTAVVASAVMLFVSFVLQSSSQAAERAATSTRAHPRYTIKSGRGWSVCEAYVKFLNAMPEGEDPPLCDNKFKRVRGMREPDWEELDIANHMPAVHQIELLLGVGRITPAPAQDFEVWRRQFRERTMAQEQTPRLRRTHLALVPGGTVETLLSYDQDVKMCEKEVGKMRRGEGYRTRLGEPSFFVFDEAKRRVMGYKLGWLIDKAGTLWLYLGKPYYFNLYVEGGIGQEMANPGSLAGKFYINRLEAIWPAASTRAYQEKYNEPPYMHHELCEIRFTYPIARIRNP